MHVRDARLLSVYIPRTCITKSMSVLHRGFSIAILALLASVIVVGAIPVHADAEPVPHCLVVFQTGTTTGITPGTTGVELTYALAYPADYPTPAPIAASFALSAASSNTAWTVASIGPSLVPPSGKSTAFDYYPITVFVNAAGTSGSTTTLNVTATVQQAGLGSCYLLTVLTTSGTAPSTVPEFPLGILALLGLALPAMILLKRKFSVAIPA